MSDGNFYPEGVSHREDCEEVGLVLQLGQASPLSVPKLRTDTSTHNAHPSCVGQEHALAVLLYRQ
jgi:hypothetical protein